LLEPAQRPVDRGVADPVESRLFERGKDLVAVCLASDDHGEHGDVEGTLEEL
jgi:hypothetical protein